MLTAGEAATRRQFLATAAKSATLVLLAPGNGSADQQLEPIGGRLAATLQLDLPAAARVPLETVLNNGLDARSFTDLSKLTADALVTRNESFFVRTTAPRQLPPADQWSISVGGLVREQVNIPVAALGQDVKPRGIHLVECSGNTTPTFGMISAAAWDGVPLPAIFERARRLPEATHVLVSGIDDSESPLQTSVPGASWVFAIDDLERAGAFLATRMNEQPLARDHGAPVRLVVPGWYGCAWIKWVDQISLVNAETPATSQMREFAARTHQNGVPVRASDFTAATIDTAAMPIRIEKWIADGRIVYRVVGIVWGGSKPTNTLQIRFKANQSWTAVSDCPLPASTSTWSLWSHVWRPQEPGRYQIVLRVDDPSIRTRRLDLYFYIREVSIDEV